jgi:hypothetical protein
MFFARDWCARHMVNMVDEAVPTYRKFWGAMGIFVGLGGLILAVVSAVVR